MEIGVLGAGFIGFFMGGIFGFTIAVICVASSKNDPYKDEQLQEQITE